MAHISELALFDYVAGKSDLTSKEMEHVQDCDDCHDEVIALRRVVTDSEDIEKARHSLAEQGNVPLAAEPPKSVHEEQRELDERPGL